MRRRELLWSVLAAAGCARSARPLREVFPREVAAWRLARVDAANAPADLQRLGAREAARAVYEGPGAVELTLYDMTNRKSAYAALRLAAESEGSVPFYYDRYFGIAQSQGAEAKAFARAFEKSLVASPVK